MKAEGTPTKKKPTKAVNREMSDGATREATALDEAPPKAEAAPIVFAATDGSKASTMHDSELDDDRRVAQVGLTAAALVIAGAVAAGLIFGPATAVLILAAGAFIAVISLFWSSLRTLLGETPLSGADAYAIGAPRAEEEQKRAVLRALKDLEFERSVGKISEEDYRRLVSHYRDQAKRLLRLLDEEAKPLRDRAEELVLVRMQSAGLSPRAATFREPGKRPAELEREALEERRTNELREAASGVGAIDAKDEPSPSSDTSDSSLADEAASEPPFPVAESASDRGADGSADVTTDVTTDADTDASESPVSNTEATSKGGLA